uniref:Intraflagellar transport protein 81 homolog n=1 Tax=Strigamia maritima TaxID=126957 RepID=T1IZS5_STRMM
MSEQLRFIVQELNKEPYNKNLNLISFDSLSDQQLLQTLNDVFADIDAKHRLDIREEEPDQTAIRMLGFLRILKYKPPMENLNNFRQGLVEGAKQVMYPLLYWLLERIPDLKKRAYLAKYLIKIDVPAEFLSDPEVSDFHLQYDELIENFKEIHKEWTQLQNSGFSTGEIRKDITNMEEEKGHITKRIERLKRKVELMPKKDTRMFQMVRNLRLEQEKEQKLMAQNQEQHNIIVSCEKKLDNLTQQLKDLKHAGLGATPEGLMQRTEEEVQVTTYLVKQKLPKEIINKKKHLNDLQKVALEPMSQSQLTALNDRHHQLNTEINQMVENRMRSNDPMDDKVALFRQQVAIVTRKKEASAEAFNEVRTELAQIEEELEEKRTHLNSVAEGGEVLRGEELKNYVNQLRGKSISQELSEIKAENGVLSRTEEILKQRLDQVQKSLHTLESKHGVEGFSAAQDELEKVSTMKSTYDEQKGRTLEEISSVVGQLNVKVNQKKAALAPLIKDLRPLREKSQNLTVEYEEKKNAYDSIAVGLESSVAKLEQEVKSLREELAMHESKLHLINCQRDIAKIQLQRALHETKLYTSGDAAERRKSLREQYTQKIQEQDKEGKALRERQKSVREEFNNKMNQKKMWSDLEKLFECKKKCIEQVKTTKSTTMRRESTGAETMVF